MAETLEFFINADASDQWFGDGSNTEYHIAQSFSLAAAKTITAVEIKEGGAVSGTPTGNWTIRIETESASKPSGTLADANASIVVAPPGLSTTVKGSFATPFALSASTNYWVVVHCDNQGTNVRWNMRCQTPSQSTVGIVAYSANGTWTTASTYDMWLKVYTLVEATGNPMYAYKQQQQLFQG